MHSSERKRGLSRHVLKGRFGRLVVLLSWVAMVMPALCGAGEALAADLSLFGPKTYTRGKGKPITSTDTFSGCASGNSGVLRLSNGGLFTRLTGP